MFMASYTTATTTINAISGLHERREREKRRGKKKEQIGLREGDVTSAALYPPLTCTASIISLPLSLTPSSLFQIPPLSVTAQRGIIR